MWRQPPRLSGEAKRAADVVKQNSQDQHFINWTNHSTAAKCSSNPLPPALCSTYKVMPS